MARITTYELDSNISLNDKLVGTDADDNSITKNYSVDALGEGLISLKNIITGTGTPNTIPMFTPDGQIIGDSNITQDGIGGEVTIGNNLTVTDDLLVGGDFEVDGNIKLGNSQANTTTINSTLVINNIVQDSNQTLGTDGQILVANAASELLWQDQGGGASLPYASYTALITQGSTNAPVVEAVLENDPIFGTLTFGRDLAGEYYVTSSLTPFSATTTACIINGGFNVRANFAWIVTSSSRIDFLSAEPPNTYSDNNFSKGLFEIRIYS